MLFYLFPLIPGYILPFFHAASRHLALVIPSLLETDPQILGPWVCADEDHLGKLLQATAFGLKRWRDVTRLW